MSVNRCYSEKKNGFDVEARSLFSSLHDLLEIKNLTHVRYLCRYDAEGLAPETYEKASSCGALSCIVLPMPTAPNRHIWSLSL